jgi:hypothetical protein
VVPTIETGAACSKHPQDYVRWLGLVKLQQEIAVVKRGLRVSRMIDVTSPLHSLTAINEMTSSTFVSIPDLSTLPTLTIITGKAEPSSEKVSQVVYKAARVRSPCGPTR